MNLPELIKKHNLKAGDDVVCTGRVLPKPIYGLGVKTLVEFNGRLGFFAPCHFCVGDSGSFELPKPVNNFVNSQCKNTAENQEALFALGYCWPDGKSNVIHNEYACLQTTAKGKLFHCQTPPSLPELYDFTTIATLKPRKQLEIERLESELKEIQERLNQLMSSK